MLEKEKITKEDKKSNGAHAAKWSMKGKQDQNIGVT